MGRLVHQRGYENAAAQISRTQAFFRSESGRGEKSKNRIPFPVGGERDGE